MTEYEDIEDIDIDADYKNSFVHNVMHVVDVTSSSCARFTYTKEESMEVYGLTEKQYEFYKSVKYNF